MCDFTSFGLGVPPPTPQRLGIAGPRGRACGPTWRTSRRRSPPTCWRASAMPRGPRWSSPAAPPPCAAPGRPPPEAWGGVLNLNLKSSISGGGSLCQISCREFLSDPLGCRELGTHPRVHRGPLSSQHPFFQPTPQRFVTVSVEQGQEPPPPSGNGHSRAFVSAQRLGYPSGGRGVSGVRACGGGGVERF